ncbi:hypothetical protein MPSEU_000098600 [Mayamaea pseudoterrestris]|nr:hypothetical protein MPSEU_000098600 [Mayamaea pseudoterrestris]
MPLFPSIAKFFGTPPAVEQAASETNQNEAAPAPAAAGKVHHSRVAIQQLSMESAATAARSIIPRMHPAGNPGRTLSHVFTQLPPNLPNRADIHFDVLEWLLHVALLQTDSIKLHQHILDIEQAITYVEAKINYGRLNSRIQLTAFYAEVCDKTIEMKMGPGLPTTSTVPTFELSEWKRYYKDFHRLRLRLLRKDANIIVPIQVMARRSSLGTSQADDAVDEHGSLLGGDGQVGDSLNIASLENPEIDAQLEQHPMMQGDYKDVLHLFAVQDALADLHVALLKIQKARPRNLTSMVKVCLQSYGEALKLLFEGSSIIPAQLAFASTLRGQSQSTLVATLIQAIQSVCLNDDDAYSYAQLQQKTRTLLIKWSESILDIPTLFALGYGGVMAPIVEQHDGDDDVSSFGDGQDAPLETQAPDPLPFRRPKYTHSPPRALKEPGFGSSPDEQIVLEQLSRGASAGSPLRGASELRSSLPVENVQQPYIMPTAGVKTLDAGIQDDFPMNQESDEKVDDIADDTTEDEAPVSPPRKNARAKQYVASKKRSSSKSTPLAVQDANESNNDERPRQKRKTTGSSLQKKDGSASKREEPDLWADSDDGSLFDAPLESQTRRTRIFWTDEEADAVREGVDMFGVGKWKQVKEWAGARLAKRDPVAIKDKWRNLERFSIEIDEETA